MKFMIESPHSEMECLRVLDEHLAKGPEILKIFSYGCMSGDHTAYALVDLNNVGEARSLVPAFLLSKARIVEVGIFTPEVVKSLHAPKAKAA